MKKKKTAYTHPKLAEYLRELFAQGAPYGWGGLDYHMEKAIQKTIEEMVANKELIIKNNLIQIKPLPRKIVLHPSRPPKDLKYTRMPIQNMKRYWPE